MTQYRTENMGNSLQIHVPSTVAITNVSATAYPHGWFSKLVWPFVRVSQRISWTEAASSDGDNDTREILFRAADAKAGEDR